MTDVAADKGKSGDAHPGLGSIAWVFARYANFTLGGGSATISVLHRELLDKRRWISSDDFTLCFALARLTPGTNLLAFCTGIGWRLQGLSGAVVALLAASIPCTAIVVVATSLFSHWQENPWAQAALHGAIAAAVAITVKTCWTIAHPHFRGCARLRVVLVAAAAFLLYVWLALPAVEVLLLAAVVGAFLPPALP
jgi:chromate transporter